MALAITGITISAEFSDKEYGNGSGNFMNISAKAPDVPLDQIDDVILDGLDLYFAAWRTLLAGRFATGIIKADELKQRMSDTAQRVDSVRKYLRNHPTRETQPSE